MPSKNIYKKYKTWRHKRHIKKFGSKNAGYFNYFNKEWFEKHQETLIWLLNHWLLKYWFRWILRIHKACKFSEYIDEIKPNTYRILLKNNTYRSDFRTHQKFSKRIYYAFRPYWYFLHSLDFLIQKTIAPEFSFGFDTLTVYPDANIEVTSVDGQIYNQGTNLTISTLRTGSNGAASANDGILIHRIEFSADSSANRWHSLTRVFLLYDTSTILSAYTISSAVLSVWPGGSGDDFATDGLGTFRHAIVSSNPASNTALVSADYNTLGTTVFATHYNTDIGSGYLDFTINSDGLLNITKAGISKFGLQPTWGISGTPTWAGNYFAYMDSQSADTSGTSSDPKLVVTYTFSAPIVTTQAVSSIADTTATGNGNVTSDGGATITERGVCWNTSTGPTTANSKATSAGTTGAYTASMTGLTASTLYYVKAYAINSVGTSYGSEVTFTSSAPVTAIKTINGLEIENVKTINGIPGASIKSIMGLTYVQPAPIVPWYGERGVFGGGSNDVPTKINVLDYITITTTGNSTAFGDLTISRAFLGACSNSTRGVFGGGTTGTATNVMDYITIATTGNATDFGDLTSGRQLLAACSNDTRGIFAGGFGNINILDYVTISTTGNATDFGDLTSGRGYLAACSSSTRGVFGGGNAGGALNIIDYITIATVGDATDFGDLTTARQYVSSCSNNTRGIFSGGSSPSSSNVIDYITIATTGNATDFGDLTTARYGLTSCSNGTRGVFAGGDSGSKVNIIDYITIASIGNASDFGDLLIIKSETAACSGN